MSHQYIAVNEASTVARPRKRLRIGGLIFVLPALLVYSLFVAYPIIHTLLLSTYQWNGIAIHKVFVGLSNFVELFSSDAIFHTTLWNTSRWIIITLLFPVILGLILASVLASNLRGSRFWSSLFFTPAIIPPVAASIAWDLIYHPRVGLLNQVIRSIGLRNTSTAWLGNSKLALYACVQIGNWIFYGFCMLVFLNALQLINRDLYEAAEIDGANFVQKFFFVTVPMLRNSITFVVVYSVISAFKAFEIVFVLTGGGPYHSSELISTYMYATMFNSLRIGYAAAIAAVLALMAFVSAALIIHIRERNG